MATKPKHYTAFLGHHRIAAGELSQVALQAKEVFDQGKTEPLLIFDDDTGNQVELDLRGTPSDVLKGLSSGHSEKEPVEKAEKNVQKGPGRPRLGVVSREVTLLPRHWEWLNEQPGGASVTLRKLVEQAKRANKGSDQARRAQDAAYRFMTAMAGNQPGYEEALRAFYARNLSGFEENSLAWPKDVRNHALKLAKAALVAYKAAHEDN